MGGSHVEDGTFLVRERTRFPGDYVLAVVYKGKATHHLVSKENGEYYTVNKRLYGNATTLEQLIENLSKSTTPGWPVTLKDFVPDPHAPATSLGANTASNIVFQESSFSSPAAPAPASVPVRESAADSSHIQVEMTNDIPTFAAVSDSPRATAIHSSSAPTPAASAPAPTTRISSSAPAASHPEHAPTSALVARRSSAANSQVRISFPQPPNDTPGRAESNTETPIPTPAVAPAPAAPATRFQDSSVNAANTRRSTALEDAVPVLSLQDSIFRGSGVSNTDRNPRAPVESNDELTKTLARAVIKLGNRATSVESKMAEMMQTILALQKLTEQLKERL